jgi:hypothetical protein
MDRNQSPGPNRPGGKVSGSFAGKTASQVDVMGCRLNGAVSTGADFSKAAMTGVSLHRSTLDAVRGGDSFRGVVIGSDQTMPLAFSVFSALGIRVDDDL